MDLTNKGLRPNSPTQENEPSFSNLQLGGDKNKPAKASKPKSGNLLKITYIALLFSVTIVLVGLLLTILLFKDSNKEEGFVDKNKYQAVFLNNGQVYFGHINELNKDYLGVSNIYYLKVSQQVQPGQQATQNDVSLVKLGCELHGPQDAMLVNRDQVTFWENLKDDGQVAKAIAEYVKANPNGPDCSKQAAPPAPESNPSDNSPSNSSTNNTEN
jgi:hypothetical protein